MVGAEGSIPAPLPATGGAAVRRFWPIALILAAVVLTYSNTLKNGFVLDDHVLIEQNPFVQDPANLRRLLDPRFYTQAHAVLAGNRPVLLASLLIDRALWGENPGGYHLTNILLHAANSLWVYILAAALNPGVFVPLIAALIFGLHPVQTEAINGVSFRADLLAAFFVFPGLWAFLKSRESRHRKSIALAAVSAGLYALGLLSKEMAASLPLLALLVELYFPRPQDRKPRLAWALALYAAVAAAYAGYWAPRFRYAGLAENSALWAAVDRAAAAMPAAPASAPLPGTRRSRVFPSSPPPWTILYEDRGVWLWTTSKTFAGYVRLLVYPDEFIADRFPDLASGWRAPRAAGSLALLGLLILAAVLLRGRRPLAGFGLAWFFIALIPVAGILPLFNPVAERYLYLVTPGFALALAGALDLLRRDAKSRLGMGGLAAFLLAGYAVRSHARNSDWKDEEALFFGAIAPEALSPRARFIRAGVRRRQGRLGEAAFELDEALRRHPLYAEAWLMRGLTLSELGRPGDARPCFTNALERDGKNPAFRFAYALFLGRVGDAAGAAAQYRAALELEPGYLQAWVNLAALHRDRGENKEARRCYEKALSLAGRDPVPFYSYALLLERLRERGRAAELYRAALERDPGYEAARRNLALLERRGLEAPRRRVP